MGKRQRIFPKASVVQTPSKDFCNQDNLEPLPCPPPQLVLPWEEDNLPKTEKMISLNDQPHSNQLSLSSSCSTVSVTASPLSQLKGQAINTGLFPKLKYQGMRRSFLPKKYHKNALPSSDFRTKATAERPTSSKQFVVPRLVPTHQSKTSVKLKHHHGVASGTNSLPKISPCRDYPGKPKLPYLKHQPRPLAYSNHRVATAPASIKQKRPKTVSKPPAPPHSRTRSSSLPTGQSHRDIHWRPKQQGRITTALLGKLDLWSRNNVTDSPSPEDHSKTTDSEKTSDQSDLHPKPPLETCPFSKKERPIHRRSETALLSLTLNNKYRNKPARPSFTKFISRGTNTYILWPQNKNKSQGHHQARPITRSPPDFTIRPRAKSVPSLPLKIWETTEPKTMTTWPDHVAEASPGSDYKVKDTTGPSPPPVQPVTIPVPELVQTNEIPPDLNDQTTVSNSPGHQDSTLVSQSDVPEATSVSTTPDVAVLSPLTESTPSSELLDKSSLIAGDHRPRDPFGFDQQVKIPIYSHPWLPSSIFSEQAAESIIGLDFQALMELENQSTPDSQDLSQPNPNDQVISSPILDHQSESATDEKAQVTLSPDPRHGVKVSLTPDHQVSHPPSINKLAEVQSKFTTTKDLLLMDQEDQILQILPLLSPKESVTPSSDSSDQKDTSAGNGDHQAKVALIFDHRDDVQSKLHYQNPIVENREISWRLKYIKPYTIQGGTLSAATVSAIINSIPEKKIKSDLCKQILLRRMKESPPRRPGQRMTFSYTVCLECASWIPNGCPHVEGMNHLSETELLAILMPLPDSEEMGVKFVLRMPKKKPFSLFNMLFPEYEMHWQSCHSSDLASCSNIESYGYPKVTRHHPSFWFSDKELFECPQITWHRPSPSFSSTEPYECPKVTRHYPSFSSSGTELYECPQLTWHHHSPSFSGTEPYECPKVTRHHPSFSSPGIEPRECPQVTWHHSSSSASGTESCERPKVIRHHPSSSGIESYECPKVTQHHPSSSSSGTEPCECPKVIRHHHSSSGIEPYECPKVTQHHSSSSSSGTEPCECPQVTQHHPSSTSPGIEPYECPQVTQHHPSSSFSGSEPRECPQVTQNHLSSSGTEPCECPQVTQHRPSSSDTEPHEYPKVTWFDLLLGKDWQRSVKKSPKHRVPHIEETFKDREDDEKKLRVLAMGFKSLLEKFEKQMKNC